MFLVATSIIWIPLLIMAICGFFRWLERQDDPEVLAVLCS
jgi:hypothetical protein